MSRPNEKPLIPSLAADGIQGQGATGSAHCWRQHTPAELVAVLLAEAAIDFARLSLERYASQTDTPRAGIPDALDWLDLAAGAIRQGGEP